MSPIVFNSNFVLLPEDKIKEKVAIVGANAVTVPVAHDLHANNWYSVKMFTDKKNQYKTYDSRVENLTFLPNLDEETLEKDGVFDGDIVVAANRADEDNIKIARMAKKRA